MKRTERRNPRTPKKTNVSGRKHPTSTNTQKGRLLEQVVAAMYASSGIRVATNVHYPTTDGERTREIDILLTANLEGLQVEYVFQCKNEVGPLDVNKLGEFVGVLKDIGVPAKYGIFVSVNGFTKGAIAYAKKMGLQLLVLRGLSKDRLKSEISSAIQHQIYLIPRVKTFSVQNSVKKPEFDWQFLSFTDEKKRPLGIVPDLIFNKWRNGEVSEQLGDHTFELQIPEGWFQFYKDEKLEPQNITATITVLAVVITLDGRAENHLLIDPETEIMERSNISIKFNGPNDRDVVPLEVFTTEADLADFIERSATTRLTLRTRLPRLIINDLYYPLSEKLAPVVFGPMLDTLGNEDKGAKIWKTIRKANENDLFQEGKVSLVGKEAPVICIGNDGETVDVKLLFDSGEFDRVIALKEKYHNNPSRAFGDLLAWAYLQKSRQILERSQGAKPSQAKLFVQESRAKAMGALEIVPGFIPAIDQLSHISHLEKDFPGALKAIDLILEREPQHVHVWIKRSTIAGETGDWELALESLDKAREIEESNEAKSELFSLLLFQRARALNELANHSEALAQLLELWRFDPVATMQYVGSDRFVENVAPKVETAEALLLYIEVLYFRASVFTTNKQPDNAEIVADEAYHVLTSMTATNKLRPELPQIGELNGSETEKVLIRCMRLLKQCGNLTLAETHTKHIGKWFRDVWGECPEYFS